MFDSQKAIGAVVTCILSFSTNNRHEIDIDRVDGQNALFNFTDQKADSYEMLFLSDGEMTVTYGNKTFHATKNDIIMLPKKGNERMEYSISIPMETVNSDGEIINVFFEGADGLIDEACCISTDNNYNIRSSFFKLRKTWDLKQEGFMLSCISYLYSIFYYIQVILKTGYLPSAKFEKIRPGIEYI